MKNAVKGRFKTDLTYLYDELEGKLRALESLGRTQEKYGDFLIPLVESCLPEETLLAWERSRNHESTQNTRSLAHLMNFLRKEVQGEEMVQLARTGFGPQHNFRKNNAPVECVIQSELATASALVSLDSVVMQNITRLTLSHNKIVIVTPVIANMPNLESLNLFNNYIEDLPTSISSLPKLKLLNLGMNRLSTLPRGFGSFPQLEVLDLTYNNLNEKNLPGNFFMIETLRALYLGDNDFEFLPPEIGQLKNLQILGLRENDLITLPKEIGELTRLRELHIQGNRLQFLPPELGNLDLLGHHCVVRMDNNPWVPPIADQLQLGVTHVIEYIRSDTYKYLFNRQKPALSPPPKRNDKTKKISRKRDHN